MQRVVRYSPLLVAIHWLFALLVVIALAGGALVLVRIPNADPAKLQGLRNHLEGGILLASLMLTRLFVRLLTARPIPATTGSGVLNRIARISHPLFYVLIFGQTGSGLVMAAQAHLPQILFGGRGALPASFWIYPARYAHYAISRALMALIALHVAGALYHTLVLRDGLLRRMWFGRRVLASSEAAVRS